MALRSAPSRAKATEMERPVWARPLLAADTEGWRQGLKGRPSAWEGCRTPGLWARTALRSEGRNKLCLSVIEGRLVRRIPREGRAGL